MNVKLIIPFLIMFFVSFVANGQTTIVTGKVIDGFDLEPVPGTKIVTRDTVLLGTTDTNGSFKIEIPAGTDQLLLYTVGFEKTLIKLPGGCDRLEIIMLSRATYDFITMNKINRLRYREFKKLKGKHLKAYQKGIFTSATSCFEYMFKKH